MKLNTLLELGQRYSLDVSQFDGALRSGRDFFSTWSLITCAIGVDFGSARRWSQEEYNTWLLTNFEQTSYISSYTKLPQNIYQDLFGILADGDVDIPARKLNTLLVLSQKYNLDVSQFDGALRSMKDFFATW